MLKFKSTSDEAKFRFRAVFDFPFFLERVFNIKLAKFHLEVCSKLFEGQLVYLILPRGFGKTTIVSTGYTLWRIWREERKQVCIFSASREQSERIIKQVQDTLLDNSEFFKDIIPESRELKWNTRQIEAKNGNMAFVKPLKPTSRGIRPHYIICDDILRDEKYTQDQVKEIFWSVIFPSSDGGRAQIVCVGTPMTTDDLFFDLEHPEEDKAKTLNTTGLLPVGGKWKAVESDEQGNWKKPLWENHPQFGNLDNLRAMQAAMGSIRFDREYLVNPTAGGAAIFTENLLSRRHTEVHSEPREGWSYYLGCDIALADQAGSDFSVYTIIGKDGNGNLFISKLERYKGKSTEWQINRIKELHGIFRFRKIVIEENGLSKGMVRTLCEDYVTKSVTEGFNTTSSNKELLIGSIQSSLSTGTLTLLDNEILINELRCFSKVIKKDLLGKIIKETYEGVGSKDDTVMSLGLALEAVHLKPSSYSFKVTGDEPNELQKLPESNREGETLPSEEEEYSDSRGQPFNLSWLYEL